MKLQVRDRLLGQDILLTFSNCLICMKINLTKKQRSYWYCSKTKSFQQVENKDPGNSSFATYWQYVRYGRHMRRPEYVMYGRGPAKVVHPTGTSRSLRQKKKCAIYFFNIEYSFDVLRRFPRL